MKNEELKPGDLIVATEIAFYDHAPDKQSQWVGDLIMVNNPRGGSVGGTGLYDGPGKRENRERPSLGLGTSLEAGTFRRATIDDPGFMATREVWGAEISRLRAESFAYGAIALLALGALALVTLP